MLCVCLQMKKRGHPLKGESGLALLHFRNLASIWRLRKPKIPRGYRKPNAREQTVPAFKSTQMDLTSDFYVNSCDSPIGGRKRYFFLIPVRRIWLRSLSKSMPVSLSGDDTEFATCHILKSEWISVYIWQWKLQYYSETCPLKVKSLWFEWWISITYFKMKSTSSYLYWICWFAFEICVDSIVWLEVLVSLSYIRFFYIECRGKVSEICSRSWFTIENVTPTPRRNPQLTNFEN